MQRAMHALYIYSQVTVHIHAHHNNFSESMCVYNYMRMELVTNYCLLYIKGRLIKLTSCLTIYYYNHPTEVLYTLARLVVVTIS